MWQTKVYKKQVKEMTQDWNIMREIILKRDKMRCLRCDKKFRYARNLSVHHIKPRAEGGGDNPENLCTLCNECHDYVEVEGLTTRADIIGSYGNEITPGNKEGVTMAQIDNDRPAWHAKVYGGSR